MNHARTHAQMRARRRRRNGRIVASALVSWALLLILFPPVGIAILVGWLILEAVGA